MKNLTYLLLVAVLISCINLKKEENINCVRPFTEKETKFLDSLKNRGYSFELIRFNYPFTGDSIDCCMQYIQDEYSLYINNFEYEKVKNLDTIRSIAINFASELYSKILSDSIINYTKYMFIHIRGTSQNKNESYGNSYGVRFKKEDIAKYLGILVSETKDGRLLRERIKNKTTNLPIENEYIVP